MEQLLEHRLFGKTKEELEEDLKGVIEIWEDIRKEVKDQKNEVPKVVYQGQSFIEKLLIDLVDKDIERIMTNDKNSADEEEQLEKTEQRKIWLRCGGFITIDKTEALTAIDVNSGKYIGNKDLEQTVFKVNKEASEEIAKQLRLRDIGGIIIIDYMKNTKEKLSKYLKKISKKIGQKLKL